MKYPDEDEHVKQDIKCKHKDNFPIDRWGNSQCLDCKHIISHLDK